MQARSSKDTPAAAQSSKLRRSHVLWVYETGWLVLTLGMFRASR